ncbi:uncharacterized protein LOC143453944 isoform X2 [Clavelina lepadiformis]|uniref:Uncharacterized protein n=1 Tax=Clavelina lepadiformis TaxID=159417 RepID=A0ABP0H171_CLALP
MMDAQASHKRRVSINNWISDVLNENSVVSQDYVKSTSMDMLNDKPDRRVSIATQNACETIIYDIDEPTTSISSSDVIRFTENITTNDS